MDILAKAPPNLCVSKVTLAAGTTTTLSNTGTIIFSIRGKSYSKSAMTNAATPTTDWATGLAFIPIPIPLSSSNLPGVPNGAAGYASIYMIGLDHSGNLRAIQGSIVTLDGSGNFLVAPQFGGSGPNGSGTTADDFCPIGYMIVKLGTTAVATWTFGTNNNSSVTGVTYVFQDLMGFTDRPQVS